MTPNTDQHQPEDAGRDPDPTEPLDVAETEPQPALKVPERIDRYRLLEKLGEGGFGTVYLAEQSEPVRRRVALKIIKPGMDTREVVSRFDAERQALALMDHVNIAKVLDAGATETGLPYFVMELVKGIPITRYCDQQNLGTIERLRLFLPVCSAIQHAHQKGVIHRDIKPSNILVTVQDGKATPKVIDFGIAKAIDARLTNRTLFTLQHQFIGTPSYMSPEQAGLSALDVDTRADIYSLGVVLYELLTGATPIDIRAIRDASYDAIQRLIREYEPPRPSNKLSSLGESSTEIARRRRAEPQSLSRTLRGDLDWIVMKSIEKDRTRRYDSANQFAEDIERYLAHQTVIARPPSAGYRLRKFARRNRAMLSTAGLLLLAIVIGGGVAAWQAVRATRAERLAMQRLDAEQRAHALAAEQRSLAQRSAARAQNEAARAESVSEFLTEMLAAADPAISLGRDTTVRDIVMQSADRVLTTQANESAAALAALHEKLGVVCLRIGELAMADANLQRAMELWEQAGDEGRELRAHTQNYLAELRRTQGKSDEAERLLGEALESLRRTYGVEHVKVASTLFNLAAVLQRLPGRGDDAERCYRDALAMRQRLLPAADRQTATYLNGLGVFLNERERSAEAEPLLREALAMRTTLLPEGHPERITTTYTLAHVLARLGRFDEAEALFAESIAAARRVFPDRHPTLASILVLQALAFSDAGRPTDAESPLREALAIREARLPAGHWQIANTRSILGAVLHAGGNDAEAEPLLRAAMDGLHKAPPARIRDGAQRLADFLDATGRAEEAAATRAKYPAPPP